MWEILERTSREDLKVLIAVLEKLESSPTSKLSASKLTTRLSSLDPSSCLLLLESSGLSYDGSCFALFDPALLASSISMLNQHASANLPFSVVCELVEKGSPVPGVVDVAPFPVQSLDFLKSTRPPKPWETT